MRKVSWILGIVIAGSLGVNVAAQKKASETKADASAAIDPEKIRAHVKFLASDLLEGRGTGQRGGDIAAEYIATEFALDGLQPAGGKNSYFQDVPMVGVKTLPETAFKLLPTNGEALTLKNLDDFVTSNESQTQSADIDAPIVFVGYGITAPEYHWDDYKNYDLHGKVALLFVNEPVSEDPKFFKGKALTYYGRWTYKFEETARRGAVATLIIHRTDLASYGWQVVRNSWGSEKSYLRLEAGTPKLQAASWIQLEVAKKLVGMAGLDLDKLFEQAQSREFKPIELPVRLQAHAVSELRPFVSRNVIAKLPGSNMKLADEAVLYTAHYDHLGINPTMSGDNIYNGAVDNGTGCGILLELARAWSLAKPAPPRSILFAAVTGEEQGLLGSEYLGEHSPVAPGKITLDLNYDALQPIGNPEEVEVTGAERTTFDPIVESTAKDFGLAIRPDSRPEAGHYYRSDHFSLARVGVPSFSIGQGLKFAGHDPAWGDAQEKDYVDHRYHQPSDEYREYMDFSGLAKMARFGYALGRKAASQSQLVGWQPGDEFEGARKKSQAGTPFGSRLFEGVHDLHLADYEPIHYPPLARQTRTVGQVKVQVFVGKTGVVVDAKEISGHPLLVRAVINNVCRWKFTPLTQPVEFEVVYSFALRGEPQDSANEEVSFAPLQIRIVSDPPVPTTNYSHAVSARTE
jgi:Zn-dependent M28 family amino/carboxypeptidase